MAEPVSVLGFSGSLRAQSLNTAVLRQLSELGGCAMDLELAEYRSLPLYDADLGKIPQVEQLKARVEAADAVLIVTPEYNYSVPGGLKNALDWLSRPAYQSVFAHKPTAILSVSPAPVGGARAQAHLKTILLGMLAEVFPHPEVAIGFGSERIQQGQIVKDDTRELLARFVADFTAWVRARGAAGP